MRRRRPTTGPGTAEEVAALYARVQADAAELNLDALARAAYVRDVLELHGTNPLEALRARYWLRRGRKGDGWRF